MAVSERIFWPSSDDPESSIAAIGVATFFAAATSVVVALVALMRGGTDVLQSTSDVTLWTYSALFGVLAIGVHRRSRAAACALLAIWILGLGWLGFSGWIVILGAIFMLAAARASFLLRPNKSLERGREG